jgi:4'-phosphopantetheinyl transferase
MSPIHPSDHPRTAATRAARRRLARVPVSRDATLARGIGRDVGCTLTLEPGAPGDPRLSLWSAPLDVSAASLHGLADSLSDEEHARAEAYLSPLDRDRFIAARGWLRRLLGGELRCLPGEVPIVTADMGKPGLASSGLRFSASRSEATALYATSWEMEVGVDIEAIRSDVDIDRLAARFFSPAERRALSTRPDEDRPSAYFRCWTRKEAYLKGIGVGVGVPLETIEVGMDPRRPVRVGGFTVHQVDVANGFAAAVAGTGLEGWIGAGPRSLGSPKSARVPGTIEP